MKKLKLLKETSPCLYTVSKPVPLRKFNDSEFHETIDSMIYTMQSYNGVGLSAPQIGINERFFVMGIDDKTFVCINPKILSVSNNMVEMDEGCLSYPELYLSIQRPEKIAVTFCDINGDLQAHEFDGLWARIFLHEFEHLNGNVFTNHVGRVKLQQERKKAIKKLKKIKRLSSSAD